MRAIPGVERVTDGRYARVVNLAGVIGTIEVRKARDRDALLLTIDPTLIPW
ncbi:MAG: AlkA N-terminal domain-containing protein [Kofleriaceae bacterium]